MNKMEEDIFYLYHLIGPKLRPNSTLRSFTTAYSTYLVCHPPNMDYLRPERYPKSDFDYVFLRSS